MEPKRSQAAKILLVLTGGTICSFENSLGERYADTRRAQTLIASEFRKSQSPYSSEDKVIFDIERPLDVLSENMTVSDWSALLKSMRSYPLEDYKGIVILHGTDTLAYTASLLSLVLAGIDVPTVLVSSQLPLGMENSNGSINFRAAVELILNGLEPNVYAVYQNDEASKKSLYVHYAAELRQCAPHSNNFYSRSMSEISKENAVFKGSRSRGISPLLYSIERLSPCVMLIEPYVGMDYGRYSLDGIRAVIHTTYHSCTLPVLNSDNSSPFSAHGLIERCQKEGVSFIIAPCNADSYSYETTGNAIRAGAVPINTATPEAAYVKAMIGCSIGLSGENLLDFMKKDVNGELL